MLYLGTKRQKEFLIDCIEEIDSQVIYETNSTVINKLENERKILSNLVNKGFGILRNHN